MENYFNRAIAGKHPLSQYIKHHSKEEGQGKDDEDLKKEENILGIQEDLSQPYR